MKVFAALSALALAGTALAQGAGELPTCAQDCATGFLESGIGDCGRNDVACICRNSQFLDDIACCLTSVCDAADQAKAVEFALQLCRGFKVTDLPSTVTCASTASSTGAAATTSTGDAAATTTAAPTTAAATTDAAPASTDASSNLGPRPTAAAAGLGAIGGIMAAVALL
ncbi:hypothetical protein VTJ83DRAFT_4698 [Remersonia thermophila]|uniref:CFEM domain-containing protein n=1 Tax=Remersonia thermophila TaxID=72144 RepID=A0ABR4DAR3_9PEZI